MAMFAVVDASLELVIGRENPNYKIVEDFVCGIGMRVGTLVFKDLFDIVTSITTNDVCAARMVA
jgi:hypothetical protein